jgi:hypothetical protein
MSVRHYSWFIAPEGDEEVNRQAALLVAQRTDEKLCDKRLCADGVERDLWALSRYEVKQLQAFFSGRGVMLKIFVQEGLNGKIRSWTVGQKKRPIVNVSKGRIVSVR